MVGAVISLVLHAQQRPAALHGHLVRAGCGAPVAYARVVAARVGGALGDYRTALADENVRFAFSGITPGTYRIHATHDGYLRRSSAAASRARRACQSRSAKDRPRPISRS